MHDVSPKTHGGSPTVTLLAAQRIDNAGIVRN